MTPEEELKKLNRLIRQFETVHKSSNNPEQRERVQKELRILRVYREKLQRFHQIDANDIGEEDVQDRLENTPFLRAMVEMDKEDQTHKDREIYHISLYLHFFERDFLAILSETRLKLDFKHSNERDSFYHRFENLRRRLDDFDEDFAKMGAYEDTQEIEIRKREFTKIRNLAVEADRFFRSLQLFADELIVDLEQEGLKCLNGDEIIQFDKVEGRRYLEGVKVKDALKRLKDLSQEVVRYLNVPQIKIQE